MTTLESPAVGTQAPDFELRGTGGERFRLSDYRGRRHVVLVFYPLAFSPGCAHQLPELQRALPRFDQAGAVIVGISVDSVFANQAFADRVGVTFTLLSDFHRRVSALYGVLDEARGHSGRALFVVSRDGTLIHKDESVNPGDIGAMPDIERALEVVAAAG